MWEICELCWCRHGFGFGFGVGVVSYLLFELSSKCLGCGMNVFPNNFRSTHTYIIGLQHCFTAIVIRFAVVLLF